MERIEADDLLSLNTFGLSYDGDYLPLNAIDLQETSQEESGESEYESQSDSQSESEFELEGQSEAEPEVQREAESENIEDLLSIHKTITLKVDWDPNILSMELKEFNQYVKTGILSSEEILDLKKARRRMKNRMYAKTARLKKKLQKEKIEKSEKKMKKKKEMLLTPKPKPPAVQSQMTKDVLTKLEAKTKKLLNSIIKLRSREIMRKNEK
jgi:hypothetical protein